MNIQIKQKCVVHNKWNIESLEESCLPGFDNANYRGNGSAREKEERNTLEKMVVQIEG